MTTIDQIRTEADLVRALDAGTETTLQDLYALARETGLADRPGGRERLANGQERYTRRVRSALYEHRRRGGAEQRRRRDGEAYWLINGSYAEPRRALFVWLPGDPTQAELVVGDAVDTLNRCDEYAALIFGDPPWGLNRDNSKSRHHHTYARDHSKVVPGYVDVDPGQYREFTEQWMTAAAALIRPGGYLAVVTSPERGGRVQCTGEDLGLTYVNQIAVERTMGMYCTSRYVHHHNVVNLFCSGPLDSAKRFFRRPLEMPRGPQGEVYAVDVWRDIPDERRPGLVRYDNMLHERLPSRVIRSTTRPGDLVVDPFLGGGSTLLAALRHGRRFYGGDKNLHSLQFAMARVVTELMPYMAAHTDPLFDGEELEF